MDDAIAIAIIENVVREQLEPYDEELGMRPRKVIADQVAREAWRRLKRDLRIEPTKP